MPQTQSTAANNKRIAKNTGLLYIRQLITLGISLYTSRLTLQVLGESDFGVYATVAGFTALLSTLTSSLTAGTQRFITFELGRNDLNKLNRVYCTSINIHVFLSILLIVFGECFGSWFIFNKMTIPPDRVMSAFWVFQFTIFNSALTLINIPNISEIIAHEDMGTWAFVAILDSVLKLIAVIMLFFISYDHLIAYAFFLFVIQFIIRTLSKIWCKRKYIEARYHFILDKPLLKSMLSVTGWAGLNNLAITGFIQGVNLLLNVFFGPVLNAAYTVAMQAYSGIRQFCSSFQIASNPQIIKLYSTNELEKMHNLLFTVCKLSFFLIFVLALPFIINAEYVLTVWLDKVPSHTESFFILLLIYAFFDVLVYPLDIAAQATGKLKHYSITASLIVLSTLVLSYIAFTFNAIPETVYIIAIIVSWIGLFARISFLRKMIRFDTFQFLKKVVSKILITGLISPLLPLTIMYLLPNSVITTIVLFVTSFASATIIIYFCGLTKSEKLLAKSILNKATAKLR